MQGQKKKYWKKGFFFKFDGNLASRWYLHSPPSGKEGWLKAGVVGGYTMLIITDLRIHLPPPPTGTPPSRRRRMEIPPTINCQVIILPIHLIIKFFLFVSLSLSFVSRQKKESCNTNVTSMTSPCNLKLRPLQAEITYTHLWRQFIYVLLSSYSYLPYSTWWSV